MPFVVPPTLSSVEPAHTLATLALLWLITEPPQRPTLPHRGMFGAERVGGIRAACVLLDGSQPVTIHLCQCVALLVPHVAVSMQCSTIR